VLEGCALFHHAPESSIIGDYTDPAAVAGEARGPIAGQTVVISACSRMRYVMLRWERQRTGGKA